MNYLILNIIKMKLPFNFILGPIMKPYLTRTKLFCTHPTFSVSIPYTYMYGTLGLCVSAQHLKRHFGEIPMSDGEEKLSCPSRSDMIVHDLRIIATSLGLIQYSCLLVGCLTENPALFLPHLTGQMLIVTVKILNVLVFLCQINLKSLNTFRRKYLWSYINISPLSRYRHNICINETMENESNSILEEIRIKHENLENSIKGTNAENSDGIRVKLRALLVALLGVSMSACAFASQPQELEMDDDDVTQKLNNVSFARRITKPTIRLVMGYGKLSAFVTATTSLLLLVAVMSKQSWWRRGARWLAAPALLVTALEAASDASDALLAAVLRGASDPMFVAVQTAAACLLITVEILVWYFIAKFFEYNPPLPEVEKKESLNQPIISNVQ